ncbi:MAG TPA: phospholipase D-like domain-containing protein [Caldimonas sp.]|jgi:phosphatidylserine/phosphatidylglycerophosphate/cardiolipin synthase-like enzyme|nr:phospholipase D-like domain-containing protein [Caldimonas sp.]
MLPNNQIGHNKFVVHVDAHGKPAAVLFGSTNWTSTGLCAQTNNTIVCDDAQIARRYHDYWKQLAKDTDAAAGDAKALQGTALRTWDATAKSFAIGAGMKATSWFSPNTPKLRGSLANEKRPPDMEEVAQLIAGARHAVLFLAFYPGSPSLANWAAAAQKANKDLFVRGCVTHPSAAEAFFYDLYGTTPAPKPKGTAKAGRQDPRVIQAQALGDNIPVGWQKEILSAGFAVTHDKIIVVDPFSPECAVVTGSHNLGHKASFNNDENLIIVRGQRALAEAYATHVLDIYDHFSWRWTIHSQGKAQAEAMLSVVPDEWQSRYFDASGNIKVAQLRFWLSALPAS